jgi:uncharacterized protein (TIGR02266 family)
MPGWPLFDVSTQRSEDKMIDTDRRRHQRVTLVTKVTHMLSSGSKYYYSRDLSLGGIFLETKQPYPIGTRLDLCFSLPGKPEKIEVECKVVRTVDHKPNHPDHVPGMGVSFITLDEDKQETLITFLGGSTGK